MHEICMRTFASTRVLYERVLCFQQEASSIFDACSEACVCTLQQPSRFLPRVLQNIYARSVHGTCTIGAGFMQECTSTGCTSRESLQRHATSVAFPRGKLSRVVHGFRAPCPANRVAYNTSRQAQNTNLASRKVHGLATRPHCAVSRRPKCSTKNTISNTIPLFRPSPSSARFPRHRFPVTAGPTPPGTRQEARQQSPRARGGAPLAREARLVRTGAPPQPSLPRLLPPPPPSGGPRLPTTPPRAPGHPSTLAPACRSGRAISA